MVRSEFRKGMGRKLFFKGPADREAFSLFETLFQKNLALSATTPIPHTIHLVWLGPKEYPKNSLAYLEKWHALHPAWEIKLWTDQLAVPPYPFITRSLVTDALLGAYQKLYGETSCLGAKSDILRLLVLQKEGGVYADHDIECRRSFAPLHNSYEFYMGLLFAQEDHLLHRSILVKNSLIGTVAHHPLLDKILQRIESKSRLPEPSSLVKTLTQTFLSFHETVVEEAKDPSFKGIIFPASYFLMEGKRFGLYAREDIAQSWHPEGGGKVAYLEKRLAKITKRLYRYMIVSSSLLLLLVLLLLYGFKRTLL